MTKGRVFTIRILCSRAWDVSALCRRLTLSKKNSGFLIQGEDKPGAIAEITSKLSDAKVNITSVQAFCAGSGRYGGMLWVKAADLRKAAKALGVGVGAPSPVSSELATRL
jgi:hypothetical protein